MPVRLRGRHRYGVRLLIHAAGRVARLNPAALLSAVWRGARGISSGRSRFWSPTVTNRTNSIFFFSRRVHQSSVSTKPKRRCLGKRSPPRRHSEPPAVDIIRTILAKRSQSQTHTHYNMTTIDFGSSGQRLDVTLEDVAAMALLYGFERPGPHAPTKPTSQRANLSDFFNVYGVNAFSKFKDKFRRETLLPPEEQKAKQEQKVSGSQNCRCALLDRMTQSDRLPIFPGNR